MFSWDKPALIRKILDFWNIKRNEPYTAESEAEVWPSTLINQVKVLSNFTPSNIMLILVEYVCFLFGILNHTVCFWSHSKIFKKMHLLEITWELL